MSPRTSAAGASTVVPQVPAGQHRVSGRHVRLGRGAVDVTATRSASRLVTAVQQSRAWRLRVGAVLPAGAHVASVRVDGHRAHYAVVASARGRQVLVDAGRSAGRTTLVVSLR